MTAQELAKMLDRAEYGREVTPEIKGLAKENSLVIVFGYSDDCMELYGAINDEFSCYGGGNAFLTKDGPMEPCDCECSYYRKALSNSVEVKAIWHDGSGYSWTYETSIPHAEFEVLEDGARYCRGIVFSMDDIPAKGE
jgi:hypothetical protein